jgi:hypothetical protein
MVGYLSKLLTTVFLGFAAEVRSRRCLRRASWRPRQIFGGRRSSLHHRVSELRQMLHVQGDSLLSGAHVAVICHEPFSYIDEPSALVLLDRDADILASVDRPLCDDRGSAFGHGMGLTESIVRRTKNTATVRGRFPATIQRGPTRLTMLIEASGRILFFPKALRCVCRVWYAIIALIYPARPSR